MRLYWWCGLVGLKINSLTLDCVSISPAHNWTPNSKAAPQNRPLEWWIGWGPSQDYSFYASASNWFTLPLLSFSKKKWHVWCVLPKVWFAQVPDILLGYFTGKKWMIHTFSSYQKIFFLTILQLFLCVSLFAFGIHLCARFLYFLTVLTFLAMSPLRLKIISCK